MKPTEIMSDQISCHLRILQRLTWLQTILLGATYLGFLRPDTATAVQIPLPNGVISYQVWLLGAGICMICVVSALWWVFRQLDLDGFSYIRRVNWHVSVLTLFVLFVLIMGPSQPGTALIGVAVGVLYGIVSATIISRNSLRQPQSDIQESPLATIQVSQREALALTQQRVKDAQRAEINFMQQIWTKPIPSLVYALVFVTGLPVLLPFILPLHPLDNWHELQTYVGWVAGIVPAVAKFSMLNTPYGQLAATVDAFIWPPVFALILVLWPYFIIPLWRSEKKICEGYYSSLFSVSRERAEIRALKAGRKPTSKMNISLFMVLIILWVFLSDLGFMPKIAPIVGPITANGFFVYALKNRFYMSLFSWMAVLMAMSAYCFFPMLLIGQLICRLKPKPIDNHPNSSI